MAKAGASPMAIVSIRESQVSETNIKKIDTSFRCSWLRHGLWQTDSLFDLALESFRSFDQSSVSVSGD